MIAVKDLHVGHVIAVPPEVKGAVSRCHAICYDFKRELKRGFASFEFQKQWPSFVIQDYN